MDVTAYRNSEKDLELWREVVGGLSDFSRHILRRDENDWALFDMAGSHSGNYQNVVLDIVEDSSDRFMVNRAEVEAEARDLLLNDELSLLICAEYHAGASAADHSNFGVLCRRMLSEAGREDLPHIFIVESRKWPCRVMGFVADMTRLSGRLSDAFVERVQWINNSWPLYDRHHADRLASRLAGSRQSFVSDLIGYCADASMTPADITKGLQAAWLLASPGKKHEAALVIVETLRDGVMFFPQGPEMFTDEVIGKRGGQLIRLLRDSLR